MIRRAALAGAVVLSACATSGGDLDKFEPARLVDASAPELRETLRGYVREQLGADYIIDPDELLASSTLTARRRGTAPSGMERISNDPPPAAEHVFQLEAYALNDGMICHLRRLDGQSLLVLRNAECALVG